MPSVRRHIVLASLVPAACRTPPATHRGPWAVISTVAPDSIVEFLLTAAATDFLAHRPPDPARFRAVQIRQMAMTGGAQRFMLCGEFLPAADGGSASWTPFATIKTSGYEQWIGAQAVGYCQGSSVVRDNAGDLSFALRGRLDSLRY